MEPSAELIDELFVEKVVAARGRSFAEKFLAGGELHEAVVERMKIGIRMEKPEVTEEEMAREIERRFMISRLLEQTA